MPYGGIETKNGVQYRFFVATGRGSYVVPQKIAKDFLKDRAENQPDLVLHELRLVKKP